MESGTIVRWLKSEGDEVQKGEPLFELDTDKVTQEVEADVGGVLLKILVDEGEVPVGTPVAFLGEDGEDVPEVEAAAPAPVPATRRRSQRPSLQGQTPSNRSASWDRPPGLSLRMGGSRRRRSHGGSPASEGSTSLRERHRPRGPDRRRGRRARGRRRAAEGAGAGRPAAGEVERVELTSLRRTVARRMTEAWAAPAFQIVMSADMTRAQELRARLVERHPDERPTVTDVLTKVCAAALMRHREVNALYAGDAIELHPSANVGIAVATDRGLLVPVIPGCELKTVAEIAVARADLVARSREGKLQATDLEGGTFTISNLGMYGVEQFVAVLNPPQAAILAVGAIEDRPVARDGGVVARPMMTLTLTCDHRTIDGATAADFLRTVKEFLEEPGLAL